MLGVWQGYLWLPSVKHNPMQEGVPIQASSYIEFNFEGLGLGVTPGASSHNSAHRNISGMQPASGTRPLKNKTGKLPACSSLAILAVP